MLSEIIRLYKIYKRDASIIYGTRGGKSLIKWIHWLISWGQSTLCDRLGHIFFDPNFIRLVSRDRDLSLGYLIACRELKRHGYAVYRSDPSGGMYRVKPVSQCVWWRIWLVKHGRGGKMIWHMMENRWLYVNSDNGLVVLADLIGKGVVTDELAIKYCRQALIVSDRDSIATVRWQSVNGLEHYTLSQLAERRDHAVSVWLPDLYDYQIVGGSIVYIPELHRGYALHSDIVKGVKKAWFSPFGTMAYFEVDLAQDSEYYADRYEICLEDVRPRSIIIGNCFTVYEGSLSSVKKQALFGR